MSSIIAIHTGAGFYKSASKNADFIRLGDEVCRKVLRWLDEGKSSALDAACYAVALLEDDALTNAGFGSNLTRDGTVECDASVMESTTGSFGACAAVSGVKNPVSLARLIMDKQIVTSGQQDLVPPIIVYASQFPNERGQVDGVLSTILAGDGAVKFAAAHGSGTVDQRSLVAPHQRKRYEAKKNTGERAASTEPVAESQRDHCEDMLDTVGAIAVDREGRMAVAASSGGVFLKWPGRIGQSATFGAGIWCEKYDNELYGCCTTGTGEQLIRTLMAKELCQIAKQDVCSLSAQVAGPAFLKSTYLPTDRPRYMGALLLQTAVSPGSSSVFLHVLHTTPAFCWAVATSRTPTPKVEISFTSATSSSEPSLTSYGLALR